MNNTVPYNNTEPKKKQIRDLFNRIAPHYDSFNHTLSLSIDRWWRRRTVRLVARMNPSAILDVATGTGDLAISMAGKMPDAKVTGVDLSPEMLEVARTKVARRGLDGRIALCEGDVESLDIATASMDVVTVAFGVRNFADVKAGLREMHRTLKAGGKLVVLEFSRPGNRLFRALYEFYTFKVLPRVGMLFSRDRNTWRYLPASVRAFPEPERFMEMMRRAGFLDCNARAMTFGIVHIYIGTK